MNTETIREFVIAAHGDLPKVKTMLAENPDLLHVEFDWGEWGKENGIGAAAHVGNREIAEFFLAQGVPSNICVAAMLGRVEEVREFLQADPALANARGAHGITVMFHAAMGGTTAIPQLLKDHGCKEGYSYALHAAINTRDLAMVKWLLENGVKDLSVQNYQGKTAMQLAQEADQPEMIQLIEAFAAQQV